MMLKNIIKALLVWMMIIPLAILNGGFREKILIPHLGMRFALPLSGLLLAGLVLLLCVFVTARWIKAERSFFIRIGILWFLLTPIFEFGFGLVIGKPWEVMLSAYDIRSGNLWPLLVIFIGCAPWIGKRMAERMGKKKEAAGQLPFK